MKPAYRKRYERAQKRRREAVRVAKTAAVYLGTQPSSPGTRRLAAVIGQVSHPEYPTLYEPE